MKRIRNLFTLIIMIISLVMISGCSSKTQTKQEVDYNALRLVESYKLVSVNPEIKTYEHGHISGSFLIAYGSANGGYTKDSYKVYNYWYQRADGGIVEGILDTRKHRFHYFHLIHQNFVVIDKCKIVVYENDNITPQVEIWKNQEKHPMIEYRFTIPKGTFRNYYNFQNVPKC